MDPEIGFITQLYFSECCEYLTNVSDVIFAVAGIFATSPTTSAKKKISFLSEIPLRSDVSDAGDFKNVLYLGLYLIQ